MKKAWLYLRSQMDILNVNFEDNFLDNGALDRNIFGTMAERKYHGIFKN